MMRAMPKRNLHPTEPTGSGRPPALAAKPLAEQKYLGSTRGSEEHSDLWPSRAVSNSDKKTEAQSNGAPT